MKIVSAIVLAIAVSSCASVPVEGIVTGEDPPGWKVGNQRDFGAGRGYIREFIPESESIESWHHLATIQFLEGETRTPIALMRWPEEQMKARCSSTDWKVLEESPHSVTYQWQIRDCPGQDDQIEIARLLQGNDGLHRIAYTEKGGAMSEEGRAYWLKVLEKSYVAKGDPNKPVVLTPRAGV